MGRTKKDPHRKNAERQGRKRPPSSADEQNSGTPIPPQQLLNSGRRTPDPSERAIPMPRSPLRSPNHPNPISSTRSGSAHSGFNPNSQGPSRERNPVPAAPVTPPRPRNNMPPPVNASTPIARPVPTAPQPLTPRPASQPSTRLSLSTPPRSPAHRGHRSPPPPPLSPAHRSTPQENAPAAGNPGRNERAGSAISPRILTRNANLNANQNANQNANPSNRVLLSVLFLAFSFFTWNIFRFKVFVLVYSIIWTL